MKYKFVGRPLFKHYVSLPIIITSLKQRYYTHGNFVIVGGGRPVHPGSVGLTVWGWCRGGAVFGGQQTGVEARDRGAALTAPHVSGGRLLWRRTQTKNISQYICKILRTKIYEKIG